MYLETKLRSIAKMRGQWRLKPEKRYDPEAKVAIVLKGLRGNTSIAELCRRSQISIKSTWEFTRPKIAGVLLRRDHSLC